MRYASVVGAVVLSLALATSSASYAQTGSKTGRVGVIVQLTGVAADFGTGVQHAVEIARQELKDAGVLDLEVFYEDHQQQAQLALVAFERLVDQRNVSVVIANASPVILALAPVATERKRLVYNFAGVSPKLRGLSPWVINGTPTADYDATALANFLVKRLGMKTVAIVHANDQYGLSTAEFFQRQFQSAGGKVVAVEPNDVGVLDMRTQLLKIKNANPDALLVLSNIPENGHVVAQAQEVGLRAKIFSNQFIMDPQSTKAAGAALNGVRGVSLRFDPESSSVARDFAAKYAKRAGRAPSVTDALAYDGARLVGEAISKVGTDPKAIRDYVIKVKDWPAAVGKINFDADGSVQLNVSMFEFVNGKPVWTNP